MFPFACLDAPKPKDPPPLPPPPPSPIDPHKEEKKEEEEEERKAVDDDIHVCLTASPNIKRLRRTEARPLSRTSPSSLVIHRLPRTPEARSPLWREEGVSPPQPQRSPSHRQTLVGSCTPLPTSVTSSPLTPPSSSHARAVLPSADLTPLPLRQSTELALMSELVVVECEDEEAPSRRLDAAIKAAAPDRSPHTPSTLKESLQRLREAQQSHLPAELSHQSVPAEREDGSAGESAPEEAIRATKMMRCESPPSSLSREGSLVIAGTRMRENSMQGADKSSRRKSFSLPRANDPSASTSTRNGRDKGSSSAVALPSPPLLSPPCFHASLPPRYRNTAGWCCTYCCFTLCDGCCYVLLGSARSPSPPAEAEATSSYCPPPRLTFEAVEQELHASRGPPSPPAKRPRAPTTTPHRQRWKATLTESLPCHVCHKGVLERRMALLHEWSCEAASYYARYRPLKAAQGGGGPPPNGLRLFEHDTLQRYYFIREQCQKREQSTAPLRAHFLSSTPCPLFPSSDAHEKKAGKGPLRSSVKAGPTRFTCEEGGSFEYAVENPRLEVPCVWCTVNLFMGREEHEVMVEAQRPTAAAADRELLTSVVPVLTWTAPPSLPHLAPRRFRMHIPYLLYAGYVAGGHSGGGVWASPVQALALYESKDIFRKADACLVQGSGSTGALRQAKLAPSVEPLLLVEILHHVASSPRPLCRFPSPPPPEKAAMIGEKDSVPQEAPPDLLSWPSYCSPGELRLTLDYLAHGRSVAVYGIGSKHPFLLHVLHAAQLKHVDRYVLDGVAIARQNARLMVDEKGSYRPPHAVLHATKQARQTIAALQAHLERGSNREEKGEEAAPLLPATIPHAHVGNTRLIPWSQLFNAITSPQGTSQSVAQWVESQGIPLNELEASVSPSLSREIRGDSGEDPHRVIQIDSLERSQSATAHDPLALPVFAGYDFSFPTFPHSSATGTASWSPVNPLRYKMAVNTPASPSNEESSGEEAILRGAEPLKHALAAWREAQQHRQRQCIDWEEVTAPPAALTRTTTVSYPHVVLLVIHRIDLLPMDILTQIVDICRVYASAGLPQASAGRGHPLQLRLLVSFDHPDWVQSSAYGALTQVSAGLGPFCFVHLTSALWPRRREQRWIDTLDTLMLYEAAGPAAGGGAVAEDGRRKGGERRLPLTETVRRVLLSLPAGFGKLLKHLIDVQEEAGEGKLVSVFVLIETLEQREEMMISQGRWRAFQKELTSNRLALYDPAEHALLIHQPKKLRRVLEEVEAERAAAKS